MKKNPYLGKFIVFDSLDGSGLSTQSNLLLEFLNREKGSFEFNSPGAWLTKEPTKGLIGGLINAQLDHHWKSSNVCLQLLFSADRAYHLEKSIIPKLKRGIIVICDRYAFSTVAFGAMEDNGFEWLLALQEKFLMPDLTFFLKVSPPECVKRITENRFETTLFEKEEVFRKAWKNYEKLAEIFKDKNVHIINGERPIKEVSKDIKNITKKTFNI